jgi:NAD(P)H-hydrate repair Nnr-like enzyme with NAD(P)H-hydrate dehydratase domain
MADTYWLKQTRDKPLFEDLLWSRPENKRHGGKLLIVGGNLHGFAAPGSAYGVAGKAGIGTARVLLPDKLQKTVGKLIPEAEFAPSTLSGSFSKMALAQLLEAAEWADGVLLAGDFGRNSETTILLDSFISKYQGLLNLAGDSIDYLINSGDDPFRRYNFVITADIGSLQKLARPTVIKHGFDLLMMVNVLGELTATIDAQIITKHADNFIVASGGQVSTTPAPKESRWQTELPAYTSVWWLQQPQKGFEAITSAVYEYLN